MQESIPTQSTTGPIHLPSGRLPAEVHVIELVKYFDMLEPSWMQQIAKIGLPAWSIEGLNNVMIYGKDLSYILPDLLGLIAYGLICYLIALRFFRFQKKAA